MAATASLKSNPAGTGVDGWVRVEVGDDVEQVGLAGRRGHVSMQ
jgi:hypothetical protein